MHIRFEALADHAYGVANAVVSVHGKFVRQDVENFAIFGKRNIARGVDRAANVFTFDVARAISESNAAAAIQTANVTASNADQRRFDGNAGNAFGLFYSAANGADGGIEIDDGAFAQAFRFGGAEREEFHLLVGKLRDKNT